MGFKNNYSIYLYEYCCYNSYARSVYFSIFNWKAINTKLWVLTLLFASFLLIITNIWQIPLCFFLAKKFGFIASIAVNAVLGLALGILISDSSFWIYCPYSWGIRLMIPVMGILSSGVLIESSNPMVSNTSLYIPCILSVCLFTLLVVISANWFSKQEVK